MSYCKHIPLIASEERRNLHAHYHDTLYGFPIHDDRELFGRLILEINQAGLSWETILKKEPTFRIAYDHFDIGKIAGYSDQDRQRLLNNAGIVRNRLKIDAAIANAQTILELQETHGSFENWLNHHHPKTKDEWVRLFKKTFRFTGGEIVNEFLMSIGFLPGAHELDCPIYATIEAQKPKWMETQNSTKF